MENKFGDSIDPDDDMLNFAGVQLDLNQSYFQVYKRQNDYWQEWNTTFATARTSYNTDMAARQLLVNNVGVLLTEGVDYNSTYTIISNTMYKAIGDYF